MGDSSHFWVRFRLSNRVMRFSAVRRLAVSSQLRSGVERGTFTNQGVKGIAMLERHQNELDNYKEWTTTFVWVPRWFRRFNESWWKWIPAIGIMFYITEYMHKINHALKRKNPADYENDE